MGTFNDPWGCPERCLGLLEISWTSIPNVEDAEDAEELGMIGNDRNRQWLLDFFWRIPVLVRLKTCKRKDPRKFGILTGS